MGCLITGIKWRDENGRESTFTLEENISAKWRRIGHLIKLTSDTLNSYEVQYKENSRRWEEVMQRWMDGQGTDIYPKTWDGLYQIIKDVNSPQVATELQRAVENARL